MSLSLHVCVCLWLLVRTVGSNGVARLGSLSTSPPPVDTANTPVVRHWLLRQHQSGFLETTTQSSIITHTPQFRDITISDTVYHPSNSEGEQQVIRNKEGAHFRSFR